MKSKKILSMKATRASAFRHTLASTAISLTAFAAISSPSAMAADPGWYVGGNIGEAKSLIDDEQIAESLLGAGYSATSIDEDDNHVGYKLFGGYQFNRNFALEGGYVDLGKFGFDANTSPSGSLNGDIEINGLNFDAVGIFPFTDKFSAFGRAGLIYAKSKDSFTGSGAVVVLDSNPSKREANYKAGVGVEYDFTPAFGMRVEAERYRINDAVGNDGDIDLISVGALYRFGQHKKSTATAPAAAPQKCPEVQPAAQCPSSVIIIPAPKTEEYCSILDIQFEINADEIQREEKERLAVIGTFMKKYPDNTAVIEGHTDNVGTTDHNMALSQQRAASVVDYLVNTYGIDRNRLSSVGYGDRFPVADNGTEEGKRMNRRINAVIACATDIEGLEVSPARTTMAMEMEFDRNAADVKPMYREHLANVAKYLKSNPGVSATVEGHAASFQGTSDEIMAISKLRAQNVVDYLVVNFGVPRSQLTAEGFGKTRRYAYNTSLKGQQENRRVNIILNYNNKR